MRFEESAETAVEDDRAGGEGVGEGTHRVSLGSAHSPSGDCAFTMSRL